MFRSLLVFAAFSASMAQADSTWAPWEISSVTTTQIDEQTLTSGLVADDDNCVKLNGVVDELLVNWDQIVAVGTKVWQIAEANKPVVNVKTPVISALPRGLSCWSDLEQWKAPKVQTYETVYKNGFGMEVVKFRFRLHYTYGGGSKGKGQYLANVTVMPAELNVSWGFNFNAVVEVGQAVNLGTSEDPIAGLELNMKWQVKTIVKDINSSYHYFVQGDGIAQAAE
ncbi:MAG: hypothetical protein KF799_04180 [Bdellovibrionales bacterium]|nr:hypothetical protein [Bdellovibrionales bacterium]